MLLVDSNVLVYATNTSARRHVTGRVWFLAVAVGTEVVGMPFVSLPGFIRISTRPCILEARSLLKRRCRWSTGGCPTLVS